MRKAEDHDTATNWTSFV